MSLLAVHTTCASHEEAARIAHALVARRLAACVHIEAIESVYVWQGVVQQTPEHRLMAKTIAEHWPAAQACIAALHSYELPAIYALPITGASPAYEAWVREAVAPV